MARVTHFEIVASDPDRAKRFYEAAFGWDIVAWDGPFEYWIIRTGAEAGHGIDGGMSRGEPSRAGAYLTLDVDSVEDVIARVRSSGGSVTQEPAPLPGVGTRAAVADTEGNEFGLVQTDPSVYR